MRVLDIVPNALHQRIPVIIGEKGIVAFERGPPENTGGPAKPPVTARDHRPSERM